MSTIINSEGELLILKDPHKPSRPRKINWWRIVGYIILLIFAILYLGPLLMLVSTSLKTLPEFFKSATALPTAPSLDNFVEAWEKASFPRLLINSAIYTTVSTVLYVITAIFVAFPLARGLVRGHKFIFTPVCHCSVPAAGPDPAVPVDSEAGFVQQSGRVHAFLLDKSHWDYHSGWLHSNPPQRTG